MSLRIRAAEMAPSGHAIRRSMATSDSRSTPPTRRWPGRVRRMAKNTEALALNNEPEPVGFPRRRTMPRRARGAMLLYLDKKRAPNPSKLRIFLAEKGLDVPTKELDLYAGEQKTAEFRALNPFVGVPILVLDDGVVLIESLPIMEYLEEMHPEPRLIGTDSVTRALIRSWERRCEIGGYLPASHMVPSKGEVSEQARKILRHRLSL